MNRKFTSIAIVIASIISLFPLNVNAAAGEKSVGLQAGYTTSHEAPVAGLYFEYSFSKHFRLKPAIDYYFRHDGVDAFAFNIDANVPFSLGLSGKFNIYPLAGLNLTSWNIKTHNIEDGDDSTTRKNRLGINVGGGIEYYVSPTLKLAAEAKYGWVKHYDGGIFNISIGYVF